MVDVVRIFQHVENERTRQRRTARKIGKRAIAKIEKSLAADALNARP